MTYHQFSITYIAPREVDPAQKKYETTVTFTQSTIKEANENHAWIDFLGPSLSHAVMELIRAAERCASKV